MDIIEHIKTNALRFAMAMTLVGYGVAILARPNASIATVAFLEARLGLSPLAVAAIFFAAAAAMSSDVHWLRFLALVPLVTYSLASAAFFIPRSDLTLVAVVQHISLTLIMLIIVEGEWRNAKRN